MGRVRLNKEDGGVREGKQAGGGAWPSEPMALGKKETGRNTVLSQAATEFKNLIHYVPDVRMRVCPCCQAFIKHPAYQAVH